MESGHHLSQELLPITHSVRHFSKTYNLILEWDEPTATITLRWSASKTPFPINEFYNSSQSRQTLLNLAFFQQATGSFHTTTPEFDWTAVEGASHYRVRIYNAAKQLHIFRGYTASPPYSFLPESSNQMLFINTVLKHCVIINV